MIREVIAHWGTWAAKILVLPPIGQKAAMIRPISELGGMREFNP